MTQSSTAPTPVVFISYSHDTKDHKVWVTDLATRLREKGVEVILDHWDTEPGDDLPKFMERGVTTAHRVLMICTEPYVRKVDDGKGGAGYEAMIVTSELVRDQGLNKFIPVIRQTGAEKITPVCLGTRKYVDLSPDKDFDEGFAELLETIHRVSSARKPPLGPNPFKNAIGPLKQEEIKQSATAFSQETENPERAYNTARTLIATGDLPGWRRFLQTVARSCAAKLLAWKTEYQPQCPTQINSENPQDVFDYVYRGVECYDSLLACLIAAAESGQKEYAGQLGWIDVVLSPDGWERSGNTFWTQFPRIILFSLHTRFGGILLSSGMGEEAIRLLTTPIREPFSSGESKPIYLTHDVMGWQESLALNCSLGWGFLNHTVEKSEWLKTLWSDQHAALASYFMFASFLEYCREAGRKDRPFEPDKLQPDTPQFFGTASDENARKAFGMLLENRNVFARVLERNGINDSDFRKTWPLWMGAVNRWFSSIYRYHYRHREFPFARLPEGLCHDPYKL